MTECPTSIKMISWFYFPLTIRGQTDWNYNQRKLANLITWTTALSNSMKLSHAMLGHPRWTRHGGEVWQMWSPGDGNGKPLQYSCLENPMNSMKRQKDKTLKDELPRSVQLSSVQSLSRVRLFATPWITVRQVFLCITNSQSLPKLKSIESVMPSNHLILCHPLFLPPSIFPNIRVFSKELFASGGQSTGASASTSVLLMNTKDWSPLEWTGWISLQSKGLSRVFSNTTVQKHQFFGAQFSL